MLLLIHAVSYASILILSLNDSSKATLISYKSSNSPYTVTKSSSVSTSLKETDEDLVTVYGEFEDLYDIKVALEEVFKDKIKIEAYETAWVSNSKVTLDGEDKILFERLITLLEDDDDVQNVYHNVEL